MLNIGVFNVEPEGAPRLAAHANPNKRLMSRDQHVVRVRTA